MEADPPEIKADGVSSTTITFFDNDPDGTQVYFETDLGHFLDDGYETTSVTRSLANGRAEVELYAGVFPGTATVTATSDRGGSAAVAVELVRLRPSGRNVSFSCDVVNIAAIADPVPDLAVHCHLELRDREGDPIDPRGLDTDDYGFMAEAGLVHPRIQDDGYGDVYFLYTATGGDASPRDVEPITNEPSRAGETGGTRNPRDGLVTIVAWVRGEEGFQDLNSNGQFEPSQGETFVDAGEPFLDVDDDGEFDPTLGDVSIDVDGNGRYDGPNGRWDEDAVLWTTFKILWTGPPHESPETSRVEMHGGRDLPAGASREVTAHLLDANMNPIAAGQDDASSDQIMIYPNCYSCGYPATYSFNLQNDRGFDIDQDGSILGNLFETPVYGITISNENTYSDPESFTIEVSADATPAPWDSDGGYLYPVHFTLTPFEGTLQGVRESPSG